MALTPEAKVKRDVAKILDKHDLYYFFPPANGYGRQGIPDIICCLFGHFIAIECKAGRGTTTVLQERELTKIRQHGGSAMVINEESIKDLDAHLERLGNFYG